MNHKQRNWQASAAFHQANDSNKLRSRIDQKLRDLGVPLDHNNEVPDWYMDKILRDRHPNTLEPLDGE